MTLKFNEVKDGDTLIADGGFTCIEAGHYCEVFIDDRGRLYVMCRGPSDAPIKGIYHERHFLDGQLADDGETLVGFISARPEHS